MRRPGFVRGRYWKWLATPLLSVITIAWIAGGWWWFTWTWSWPGCNAALTLGRGNVRVSYFVYAYDRVPASPPWPGELSAHRLVLTTNDPRWWSWVGIDSGDGYGGVAVPFWMLVLALGAPTAWLWYRDHRRTPTACPRCGYSFSGLPANAWCPECGHS